LVEIDGLSTFGHSVNRPLQPGIGTATLFLKIGHDISRVIEKLVEPFPT